MFNNLLKDYENGFITLEDFIIFNDYYFNKLKESQNEKKENESKKRQKKVY